VTGPPVIVAPTPNVVLSVRDLHRVEGAAYHMERVIELTEPQSRLFGLVHAKDALLLVAVGDVTAGVDLDHLADGDVTVDWANKRVRIRLPEPEIFSVAIDNAKTHVYTRTTDVLASRSESLEGRAREEAEVSMRQAARDAGLLDRARAGAARAVTSLVRALGFTDVEVE
jgi:hypothetical protein